MTNLLRTTALLVLIGSNPAALVAKTVDVTDFGAVGMVSPMRFERHLLPHATSIFRVEFMF